MQYRPRGERHGHEDMKIVVAQFAFGETLDDDRHIAQSARFSAGKCDSREPSSLVQTGEKAMLSDG